VNLLKKITDGVTDDNVYKRIGWMVVSFFVLFVPVTVLSFYLLPEGVLRGRHPIISALEFSSDLWTSTLQIFGYNLIPTFLIIGANLLAQQSRLSGKKYVPIGYTAFWGLTVLFAVVLGTWSFGVITAAPPLFRRFARILDVFHHAGLLEFSAYLLAAATSFKFTLWYSDRKEIIASRAWRDTNLTGPEKVFLVLAFVLLLCAAFVESYGIIHLTG
jgi:uncharacterized membrane protein SpoIIM required for sporulation